MLHTLTLATMLVAAAAAPATYDQRQDGDFNVRADVQNVVLVIALPDKMKLPSLPVDIFAGGLKSNKHDEFQERADVRVMEAFVEPSTPYRVDIGSDDERYADTDGRNVEVVIAGRRRLEAESQEAEADKEEYKLLGAQEQCGPGRERDPVTLTCRAAAGPQPEPSPEPVQPQPEAPAPPQPEPAVVVVSS